MRVALKIPLHVALEPILLWRVLARADLRLLSLR